MSYSVHYNAGSSRHFSTFDAALSFYRERVRQPHGATLLGDGADWDIDADGYRMRSDGLSEAERDAVEGCS